MGAVRILLAALAGFQLFGCVLIDWMPIRYEPLTTPVRVESAALEKPSQSPAPDPVVPPEQKALKSSPARAATEEKRKSVEPGNISRRKAAPLSLPDKPPREDRRVAEMEDPEAQYSLGCRYFNGEEVERDYARALDLFLAAARQGHAGALRVLGHMHENGFGVPPDPAEAARWYGLAAGHGDTRAMTAFGYMVFTGYGMRQNTEAGLLWLRAAGEQGNSEAQLFLGAIYDSGWSVSEDDAEALAWYARSAEGGDPLARFLRACMHALGESVPLNFVSAAKDYRMAAVSGFTAAQAILDNRYINLSGEEPGLRWKQSLVVKRPRYAGDRLERFSRLVEIFKGAALGDADAMFRVGSFYWRGEGLEKDFGQAVRWWRLAARLGNGKAKDFLARIEDFEKNGAGASTMTRLGEKEVPAALVYEIGLDLLDAGDGSEKIHPSSVWMNMLRRSRELSRRP